MPRITRPVPPHSAHSVPLGSLPLPLHWSHISSAVPGLPGLASSPGFMFGSLEFAMMDSPWKRMKFILGGLAQCAARDSVENLKSVFLAFDGNLILTLTFIIGYSLAAGKSCLRL